MFFISSVMILGSIWILTDRSWRLGECLFSRILDYLDTWEGLVENMILHYRGFVGNQILDYEGVPFKCCCCHQVEHVYKDCPLLLKDHRGMLFTNLDGPLTDGPSNVVDNSPGTPTSTCLVPSTNDEIASWEGSHPTGVGVNRDDDGLRMSRPPTSSPLGKYSIPLPFTF